MVAHPLRNALEASPDQTSSLSPIIRSTPFSKNIISIASSLPNKRQKMSIHQTYVLAHQARNKLTLEASRPAHNLRLLVGHANMLDSLMLELADAEKEQERWFHQTVSRANEASTEPSKRQHIQWADTVIPEEDEEEDTAMDTPFDSPSDSSDSDSEDDEAADDDAMSAAFASPVRRAPSPPATIIITTTEVDPNEESDDEGYEDEDSEDGDLALVRVRSHSNNPPELLHEDSDVSESEDESMPPSPEQPLFELSEKQSNHKTTNTAQSLLSSRNERSGFFDEEYYLPERNSAMVTAY